MRDIAQRRLQAWSYQSDFHKTATRVCASKLMYPLYGGMLALAIRRRAALSTADLLQPLGAATVAKLMAKFLHGVVIVPRPFEVNGVPPLLDIEPDNGFPSDHALQVGTLLMGAWILEPVVIPLYVLGGALTLGARLGAGVHHTADVVAGLGIVAVSSRITTMLLSRTGSSQISVPLRKWLISGK
jgi:membrane-associated phospholipid phosphatase